MALTYIRPAEFMMGSPADEIRRDDDETQNRIRITKGFYMGVHEVTQSQ